MVTRGSRAAFIAVGAKSARRIRTASIADYVCGVGCVPGRASQASGAMAMPQALISAS